MDLAILPAQQASAETVRQHLASRGACLLQGLDASSSDSLLDWAQHLGNWELGIDEELLGPRLMHLRLDPGKVALADQPAYFTADEFPLHTDVSYVPNPPGLMLMHCVQPDELGGGLVHLARCDEALQHLAPDQADRLRAPVYRFLYPPACPQGASEAAAILAHGRWRFKFASMQFAQEYAATVDAFYQALLRVRQTIQLRSGDLLIVDNHRLVHGRTAFAGTSRHIMRCYVNPVA